MVITNQHIIIPEKTLPICRILPIDDTIKEHINSNPLLWQYQRNQCHLNSLQYMKLVKSIFDNLNATMVEGILVTDSHWAYPHIWNKFSGDGDVGYFDATIDLAGSETERNVDKRYYIVNDEISAEELERRNAEGNVFSPFTRQVVDDYYSQFPEHREEYYNQVKRQRAQNGHNNQEGLS